LAALGRNHSDLKGERIAGFPSLGIARYMLALFDKQCRHGKGDDVIAKLFARCVRSLDIGHDVIWAYSYDSLELLQHERERGVFTILCQTDPGPAHYRMIIEEEGRWPEYTAFKARPWEQQRAERVRQEWDLANVIVVNSAWTRDAIVAEGAEAAKIEILPLAFEAKVEARKPETLKPGGKLRVLWLGNFTLGKGIQYFVEAARLLIHEPVQFLAGGTSYISHAAMQSAPRNLRWLGQVPRSAVTDLYQDCDVFVFPTLSDGFGMTQLEAMAHGVPVIATPNCGQVVEDGKTGFVIPPRDPKALAEAIMKFVSNRHLSFQMAPACLQTVKAHSFATFGQGLREIIEKRKSLVCQ
jgi:glycosyltransferase involved in cell wall biosynthesis